MENPSRVDAALRFSDASENVVTVVRSSITELRIIVGKFDLEKNIASKIIFSTVTLKSNAHQKYVIEIHLK